MSDPRHFPFYFENDSRDAVSCGDFIMFAGRGGAFFYVRFFSEKIFGVRVAHGVAAPSVFGLRVTRKR